MGAAVAVDRPITTGHTEGMADPVTPREKARVLAERARETFGVRLQAWREYRGLTRAELAFYSDLSEDSIRNLEEGRIVKSGVRRPAETLSTGLLRIALCLGVSLDDLMLREPPARSPAVPG